MAASVHTTDGDVGFQIAPLIDVVFVLMLFFMALAGLRVKETPLLADLPGRGGSSAPGIIAIEIGADGALAGNGRAFPSPAALREWLAEIGSTFGHDDTVVIRPNPATRHEHIMGVLNAARLAGATKVALN